MPETSTDKYYWCMISVHKFDKTSFVLSKELIWRAPVVKNDTLLLVKLHTVMIRNIYIQWLRKPKNHYNYITWLTVLSNNCNNFFYHICTYILLHLYIVIRILTWVYMHARIHAYIHKNHSQEFMYISQKFMHIFPCIAKISSLDTN